MHRHLDGKAPVGTLAELYATLDRPMDASLTFDLSTRGPATFGRMSLEDFMAARIGKRWCTGSISPAGGACSSCRGRRALSICAAIFDGLLIRK